MNNFGKESEEILRGWESEPNLGLQLSSEAVDKKPLNLNLKQKLILSSRARSESLSKVVRSFSQSKLSEGKQEITKTSFLKTTFKRNVNVE